MPKTDINDRSLAQAAHLGEAWRVRDAIDVGLSQVAIFEGHLAAKRLAEHCGLPSPRPASATAESTQSLPSLTFHRGSTSPESYPSESLYSASASGEVSQGHYWRPGLASTRHRSFSGNATQGGHTPSPSLAASVTSLSECGSGVLSAPLHQGRPMPVAMGPSLPLLETEDPELRSGTSARRSKAKRRVTKREGEVPACLGCGRLSTAEWRRGPTGPRTLCNACGLLFAKMARLRRAESGHSEAASSSISTPSSVSATDPTLEELRQAVGTSAKGQGSSHAPLGRLNVVATGSAGSEGPRHVVMTGRHGWADETGQAWAHVDDQARLPRPVQCSSGSRAEQPPYSAQGARLPHTPHRSLRVEDDDDDEASLFMHPRGKARRLDPEQQPRDESRGSSYYRPRRS